MATIPHMHMPPFKRAHCTTLNKEARTPILQESSDKIDFLVIQRDGTYTDHANPISISVHECYENHFKYIVMCMLAMISKTGALIY